LSWITSSNQPSNLGIRVTCSPRFQPGISWIREHGISGQTLYNRKAKYGGLKPSGASRLKGLEEESWRLKKLSAGAALYCTTQYCGNC
jgi:hypothetical protein